MKKVKCQHRERYKNFVTAKYKLYNAEICKNCLKVFLVSEHKRR